MKTLQKTFAALIAGISFVAVTSSASAQTAFTAGEAVKAEGTLTQSLLGSNETICHVTFLGHATGPVPGGAATGFKFDSYTGNQTGGTGDLACDNSIVFDNDNLIIDIDSSTDLTLRHILIETREGNCEQSDVPLTWDGTNVTFPDPTIIFPVCQFAGTLAVSAQ